MTHANIEDIVENTTGDQEELLGRIARMCNQD
jgi:hypothetical protein